MWHNAWLNHDCNQHTDNTTDQMGGMIDIKLIFTVQINHITCIQNRKQKSQAWE